MTIKQKIRNILLGGVLVVPLFAGVVMATPTFAAECGGVKTAILTCDETGKGVDSNGNECNPDEDGCTATIENTGLWGLLLTAINILTAGVGVVALGGIIYGAVLYTSAGGNTEQVKKARSIFMNVAIGVVAFAGMFALLNFIIPGGVFN